MSITCRTRVVAVILMCVVVLQSADGWSHGGHGNAIGARPNKTARRTQAVAIDRTTLAEKRPHGGHVHRSTYHSFEVLYLPHETRVYIYGPTEWPTTAQGVVGTIAMQVKGNPTQYRYNLHYVPKSESDSGQDYLAADVDVTRVRDGDMTVTFGLSQLPYAPIEASAIFDQQFALSSHVAPRFASTHLPDGEACSHGDHSNVANVERRGLVHRFLSFVGLTKNAE